MAGEWIVIGILAAATAALAATLGYLAVSVFHDRSVTMRSQDEVASKFSHLLMQTAMAVEQSIDERVKRRVALVNSLLRREDGTVSPETPLIGEQPPIVSTTNTEEREIRREESRKRRPGAPPARDAGVGVDPVSMGMPSIEELRKMAGMPLEEV